MTALTTARATSRPTVGCTCYCATSGVVILCAKHAGADALIEALTQACESARDCLRRECGWPTPNLWVYETLKALDAVIERAVEAQS